MPPQKRHEHSRLIRDIEPEDELFCNICLQWKEARDFHICYGRVDGHGVLRPAQYDSRCRSCDRARENKNKSDPGVGIVRHGRRRKRSLTLEEHDLRRQLQHFNATRNREEPGYVYLAGEVFSKRLLYYAFKIGFSKEPFSRMSELQTGNPRDVILLGYISGSPHDERRLHNKFAHLRIRPDGEWFRYDAGLFLPFGLTLKRAETKLARKGIL